MKYAVRQILIPILAVIVVFTSVPGAVFAEEPSVPVGSAVYEDGAVSGVSPESSETESSGGTEDPDGDKSSDTPDSSENDGETEPSEGVESGGATGDTGDQEDPGNSGNQDPTGNTDEDTDNSAGTNAGDGAGDTGVTGDQGGVGIPVNEDPVNEEPAEGTGTDPFVPELFNETEPPAVIEGEAAEEPVEILVVMKDSVNEETVVRETDEIIAVEPLGEDEKFAVVEAAAESVETAIAEYESDPNVEFAQPNYEYSLLGADPVPERDGVSPLYTTSDPEYSKQWSLSSDFSTGISEAWDMMPPGGVKVRVGILDTGVDIYHPDLAANINAGLAYNVTTDNGDVTDTNGHGTHVAGILAADTDNSIGIAGAANDFVEIVPIKMYDAGGNSTTVLVVKAIKRAIEAGCKIINISAGGPVHDPALKTEIDAATARGVLVIAAAGNDNTAAPVYPSDYQNVTSVTATGPNNEKASYSSWGGDKDIAAPGGNGEGADKIYSTYPQNLGSYAYNRGTSMAAPYVAAVAALIWVVKPGLTPEQVREVLYKTATDLGDAGKDVYFGHGLVNAKDALDAVLGSYVVVFQNHDGSLLKSEIVRQGQNATPPAAPFRTGYTFLGWDRVYTNVTTDLTITAQYTPNQYIAMFNANGGLPPNITNMTVIYDSPVGALPYVPTRPGYTFTGWYTAPVGGTQITPGMIWRTAGNVTYYAQYTVAKNKWVKDDAGNWYYMGSDGNTVKGWRTVDGKRRYFDSVTGAVGKGVMKISGKWYYFTASSRGVFSKGLKTVSGKTYYFGTDGKAKTGWQTVSGKRRYFDKKTAVAPVGVVKISGKWYYFTKTSKGAFSKGLKTVSGKTYYFGTDGKAKTGWQTVSGKRRYFDKKTAIAPVGVVKISGKWYYFTKTSKGAFSKGLKTVSGNTYYFGTDGKAKTGWQTVSGKKRYFDKKTAIAPKGFKSISKKTYYFSPTGKGTFYVGYKKIDGFYYLFNDKGHMYRSRTVVYKGWTYEIDSNGCVISRTKGKSAIPKGLPPMKGIDVSEWQGSINWAAVKASGVKFAVIRAGWTDWAADERGHLYHWDKTYVHNVREAKKHGILVGAYLFVYSRNIEEQKGALNNFHKFNKEYGLTFDLPVFLDIEDSRYYLPSTDSLGGNSYRTRMLRSGLDQLSNQGYDAGFYASLDWANTKFDTEKLVREGNAFWLACWYGNNAELSSGTAAWNGKHPALWQYRSTGSVPGISGNVDMNWLYPGNMP